MSTEAMEVKRVFEEHETCYEYIGGRLSIYRPDGTVETIDRGQKPSEAGGKGMKFTVCYNIEVTDIIYGEDASEEALRDPELPRKIEEFVKGMLNSDDVHVTDYKVFVGEGQP